MDLSTDIDVHDVYWAMSEQERNEMAQILDEEGYFDSDRVDLEDAIRIRFLEDEIKYEMLTKLFDLFSSNEMEELIKNKQK